MVCLKDLARAAAKVHQALGEIFCLRKPNSECSHCEPGMTTCKVIQGNIFYFLFIPMGKKVTCPIILLFLFKCLQTYSIVNGGGKIT